MVVKYHTDKVAILLATYQGETYIKEQLDSLLTQKYAEWIAYIHDDGSTDQTTSILKSYVEKYPDKFVIIPGPEGMGAKNNFFYLLDSVDAPYIMCCDQDDIWLKEKIEITLQKMHEIEENCNTDSPCLVFTDLSVVDANGNVLYPSMGVIQQLDYSRLRSSDIAIQNVVTGCTMMINRAVLSYIRSCTDRTKVIWHDWWCALICAEFGKIACIDDPTICYRKHSNNAVGARKVNSLSFIKEKIRTAKHALQISKAQAESFCKIYSVKKESLLYQYVESTKRSKVKRLYFLFKHKLGKNGFLRNVGLLIFD